MAGRARQGLEEWAEQFQPAEVPQVLLAGARILADQLDEAPGNSPLWGRYADVVRQLTDHVEALRSRVHDELRPFLEQISHAGDIDAFRASKYREAKRNGEDPSPWERLVPATCARGEHRWHEWVGGLTTCEHCDAVPAEG